MIVLNFSNESHNMKAMIILSHSWSPFLLLTYLYGENKLLWGTVCPFGIFSQDKNSPSFKRTHLQWDIYTKLSLSNIMKHGKIDVEWQISIQGIHLSAFWNYCWRREESFKFWWLWSSWSQCLGILFDHKYLQNNEFIFKISCEIT